MQKESRRWKIHRGAFLSQFSFSNDVLYDRNISVAISMDYRSVLRVYERALEADVERWEIINTLGIASYFVAPDFFGFKKIYQLNITYFLILHIWYGSFFKPLFGLLFELLFMPLFGAIMWAWTTAWTIIQTIIQTTLSLPIVRSQFISS